MNVSTKYEYHAFDAVIFDFDGVILDSEPIHYEACCNVLKDIGLTLTYEEYVEKYIGISDKEMFPKILINNKHHLAQAEINSLINKKIENYNTIINSHDNLPIVLDVDQYIRHMTNTINKIAICSGSTRSEITTVLKKLQQKDLQSYFNIIITSDDVVSGKPSPEGYLLTAKQLGVTPNRCLVLEDSPHGVDAAKNAGMYVIAILTTHDRHQLKQADKIVERFTEIL